jgi:CHAT domain-containing protein
VSVSSLDSRHIRTEAQALARSGDFPGAEARLSSLLEDLDPIDPGAALERFRCYQDRSVLRRLRNDWDGALGDLDYTRDLLATLPRFVRRGEETGLWHARAKLFASKADLRRDPATRRADRLEARRCLDEVRGLGGGWVADELESSLAERERDWPTVAACCERTVAALRAEGWQLGVAMVERRWGEALVELGDPRAADLIGQARSFFDTNGPPDELAKADMALARLLSAGGDHDGAWGRARQSLDLLERLVRRFRALGEQLRYLADKAAVYETAYHISMAAQGDTGVLRGWTVVERAKSFYLCQLLANADVDLFEGVDSDDLALLRSLEDELDCLAMEAAAGDPQSEVAAKELSTKRLKLLESMMASSPRWASFRVPPPLDMADELRRLPDDWVPVSFFWHSQDDSGETLTLFWVDADGRVKQHDTRWGADDLATIEARRSALRGLVPSYDSVIPSELGDKLVPACLWRDLRPASRLLVSPHGRLRGFPVHAVAVEGQPAILRWPIQYIPALGILSSEPRASSGGQTLLIGSPSTPFNPVELPQVETELEEVESAWSATGMSVDRVIVGRNQTLAQTRHSPDTWAQCSVLHLSCHGEFPADRPFDAALLLGRDALRASEFFTLRLPASIIVLSACSVGEQVDVPEGYGGDEWIGLYLPLLYAGAERMLVSLWEAEADPARSFMVALHERLATGEAPDRAMVSACSAVSSAPLPFWTNWYLVGRPEVV